MKRQANVRVGSREADGGDERLLRLPAGAIRIRVDGPVHHGRALLLIHAFAGSSRAWEPVIPELMREHTVVRVDLLGHGASDKPKSGYSMAEQATAVCAALDELGIEDVVAVGHSGGGDVVVAMIEHHRERLSGAILLGTPPDLSFVNLPVTARLVSAPGLGRILWRLATDGMIRDGLKKTFAPGFEATPKIYEPFVADLRRMTHHSYVKARAAVECYRKSRKLTDRVAGTTLPMLVVFGDQDQWVDPRAAEPWKEMAQVEILGGVGHTPMIEAPSETAALILTFAERVSRESRPT